MGDRSPATIPEVEGEIAHEFRMTVLDIDSGSQTAHIFRDVIAEDDRAHRRLSRATFAHQEHFLFLLASVHVAAQANDTVSEAVLTVRAWGPAMTDVWRIRALSWLRYR